MRVALALAAVLAVAGCRDKPPAGPVTGGGVLPGSASDAMIAYDTLRSQPPLVRASGAVAGRNAAEASETAPPDPDATTSAAASEPADAPGPDVPPTP